jgi:hypothetical protein
MFLSVRHVGPQTARNCHFIYTWRSAFFDTAQGARPTKRAITGRIRVGTRAALSRAVTQVVEENLAAEDGRLGCGAAVLAKGSGRVVRTSGVRTTSPNGGPIMRNAKRVTIFELVKAVQDTAGSDEEVVAVLTHILRSARATRPLPAVAA